MDETRTRVAIHGDVDYETIGTIGDRLDCVRSQANLSHLVLDLAGTTFMDSTGLRLLVGALTDAQRAGYLLSVMRGPPGVQRTIEVAGLHRVLLFVDDPVGSGSGDRGR